MGKIIAIANQKGGVGKTTTSINLAASLAVLEYRTLIIDADPQANTTSGLNFNPDSKEHDTLYEVLIGEKTVDAAVKPTDLERLDIITSHINLVGAEIEMLEVPGRENVLRNALSPLRDQYDFIILDCAPSLGLITINALTASDSVIIPVQPEYFPLEGLGKLLNTINIVRTRLNPALTIEGFLFTMYDSRLRLHNQVVEEVKTYYPDMVFKTMITKNVRLSEAPSYGKPALLYDARSTGAVPANASPNASTHRGLAKMKTSAQPAAITGMHTSMSTCMTMMGIHMITAMTGTYIHTIMTTSTATTLTGLLKM